MPNWVDVKTSITGTKEKLDILWDLLDKARSEGKKLCETFRPMPPVLLTICTGGNKIDGVSVSLWRTVEGKNVAIPKEELDSLVKEYGTASWYDWALTNWGMKWDHPLKSGSDDWTPDPELTRKDRSISMRLQCPWSPPDALFQHIANTYGVTISTRLSVEWDGKKSMSWSPEAE
jgi:hypothetical protein